MMGQAYEVGPRLGKTIILLVGMVLLFVLLLNIMA